MSHPPGKKSDANGHRSRSRSPSVSSTTRKADAARGSSSTADATKGETDSASHNPGTITASPKNMRDRSRSRGPSDKNAGSEGAGSSVPHRPVPKKAGPTAATGRDNSNTAPLTSRPSLGDIMEHIRKGSHSGSLPGSRQGSVVGPLKDSESRQHSLAESPDLFRRDSEQLSGKDRAKATTHRATDESPPSGTNDAKHASKRVAGVSPSVEQPPNKPKGAVDATTGPTAPPKNRTPSGGIPETPTGNKKPNNLKVAAENASLLSPSPRHIQSDVIQKTPATRSSNLAVSSDRPTSSGGSIPPSPARFAARKAGKTVQSAIQQAIETDFRPRKEVHFLRIRVDPLDEVLTKQDPEPHKHEMKVLESSCIEFDIVGRAIHLGLRILETPEGLTTLVDGAKYYIWNKKRLTDKERLTLKQEIIYDRDESELLYHAVQFVKKLRNNFPNVYITRTLKPSSRAETERYDWPRALRKKMMKEQPELENYEPGLEDYNPKYAAGIYINQIV